MTPTRTPDWFMCVVFVKDIVELNVGDGVQSTFDS
jgi:hypothetical protein